MEIIKQINLLDPSQVNLIYQAQKAIDKRSCILGNFDYDKDSYTISHTITNIFKQEDQYYCTIQILDTPRGKVLANLIKEGYEENIKTVLIYKKDKFFSIDLVYCV